MLEEFGPAEQGIAEAEWEHRKTRKQNQSRNQEGD